jgi:hypothetical protein
MLIGEIIPRITKTVPVAYPVTSFRWVHFFLMDFRPGALPVYWSSALICAGWVLTTALVATSRRGQHAQHLPGLRAAGHLSSG